jgi:hypothetical protein
MTNLPSHPAGTRPSRAELAEVTDCLDRMGRRMECGCATAAGLFAVGGTGAPASAVHQYAVVHDGFMASAGGGDGDLRAAAIFGPRRSSGRDPARAPRTRFPARPSAPLGGMNFP